MTPELERLINEINEDREKRRIQKIRYALDAYLTARQKREDEAKRQRTWRYRIKRWFEYSFK